MKRMVCEMCGGTDFIKQDGTFVCQSCGVKYSVEEAKKMIVEGTVDVSGSTVKVDTSDELANLYQIARRARDDNNRENAAKYYDMILIKDPTSWEASFFLVVFQSASSTIAEIRNAAISMINCQGSVIGLIHDQLSEREQVAAVKVVAKWNERIAKLLATEAKRAYDRTNSFTDYKNRMEAIREIMYTCGNELERFFCGRDDIGTVAAQVWKAGIALHELSPMSKAEKVAITVYERKICRYDPTFICKATIELLVAEIKELKESIKYLPSTPEDSKANDKNMRTVGIVCIITGIIGAPLMLDVSPLLVVLALLAIPLGILFMKPASEERVAELCAQKETVMQKIKEKEKELAALQNSFQNHAVDTRIPDCAAMHNEDTNIT